MNVLFVAVARKKTNAEKHCSRRVKMNALFFRTSRTGYSVVQSCPRKEFSCTPPCKCQHSHTSDVLPISQSIIRNIRTESLFGLRINDIHTPFRHLELASTRLTFRQRCPVRYPQNCPNTLESFDRH